MASKSDVGGYDLTLFLDKNSAEEPRYTCSICTKVFREPHLTACCGQHFCGSCLEKWLETKKTCPNCREARFQHFLDKNFQREIDVLKIKCPNNKEGCTCEFKLGSLKQHLESENGCDYALVECPKRCFAPMQEKGKLMYRELKRKDLDNHLATECSNRPHNCTYCGKTGPYESHVKYCDEKPTDCPNECGEQDIKQKDIIDHCRNWCPLQPVECPFKDTGCKTRPPRNALTNHIKNSIEDHLLLTAQTCRKLQRSNQALSALVDTVLENFACEPGQREALVSARSMVDVESYHLREEGPVGIYKTATYNRRQRKFLTPSFYLLNGYKVYLEMTICRGVDGDPAYIIESQLMLQEGEFDDLLEWPLCNDFEIHIGLEEYARNDGCPISTVSSETESTSSPTFSLTNPIPICSECSHNSLDRPEYSELSLFTTRDSFERREAEKAISKGNISLVLGLESHSHAKRRRLSSP